MAFNVFTWLNSLDISTESMQRREIRLTWTSWSRRRLCKPCYTTCNTKEKSKCNDCTCELHWSRQSYSSISRYSSLQLTIVRFLTLLQCLGLEPISGTFSSDAIFVRKKCCNKLHSSRHGTKIWTPRNTLAGP